MRCRSGFQPALGGGHDVVDGHAGADRRVSLAPGTGFETDFGFAAPSWAGTEPVDARAARVVRSALLPLHDPLGAFELLIAAVRAS
jgi:hypothetical protein